MSVGFAIFLVMAPPFIVAVFWPKGKLPYNW